MNQSIEPTNVFLAHIEPDGRSQKLLDHLLAVSGAAGIAAEKIGIGAAGATIGLLHDFGKYSRDFQSYLRRMTVAQDTEQPGPGRGKIDHSTAGAQAVWRRLWPGTGVEKIVGEVLSICVASHHSGLIDCISPEGTDNLSRRMCKADLDSHYSEARASVEKTVAENTERHFSDPRLVGCVRDVIAQICRDGANETIRRFKIGLLVRFLFSCLIDADRTDTADSSKGATAALRQRGRYVGWPILADRLEGELGRIGSGTQIGLLRREVSDCCLKAAVRPRGIYTLTVPTGGGKTLASLRFAANHAAQLKMDRVIYFSPYTSIIDQNAEVVRKVLEPEGTEFGAVVLEHHSNLTPLKQTWRSKVLSENWDAPVIFTTAVQFLEAFFGSGTRAVRRMHQMANSVLIFDEIQTLPVRCVHLFNNAINFLVENCRASVVLCTATQPLLGRVDARKGCLRLGEDAEIMPDVRELFSKMDRYTAYDRRKPGGWERSEAAEFAIDLVKEGGSCLLVVNTKAEALSIYRACRTAKGARVYHLSAGMCPAHRLKVLAEVKTGLDNHKRVICVSTQLIEAGVDISFHCVIRALAGIDSIAQAAGRCNRHAESSTGRVFVVNLAGKLPGTVADIRLAQEAAARVLDECCTGAERRIELSDPRIIEKYFYYYFFDRRKEMDYPVKAERGDSLLNMLSENRMAVAMCRPRAAVYLRQAFMTAANAFQAIDSITQGVIVPYGAEGRALVGELCAAYELEKQFALLKRAQTFTVNVFPHVLTELQEANAARECQVGAGVLYLDERYYSNNFGLNVEGTEEMEMNYV